MKWFFGKKPMSPDAVRDALVDAADARDASKIDELADKQRAVIVEHFAAWQEVPEAIRSDAGETKRYVGALMAVAEHFKNVLGDPSLHERLVGSPRNNPLVKWQKALAAAHKAVATARYSEAEALVREGMNSANGASGSGVDRYLPISWGLLGQCKFHQGKASDALALFWRALELCDKTENVEGAIAHLTSLHEARRRAERVRAGEPLNRVVIEAGGKSLEIEELASPLPEGRVRFHFERNRIELGGVTATVEEGSKLGSRGDDTGALGCFRSAAALDPHDPRPHYFAGLALMGLGRYPAAVESYETTERLAPGWYHCRADRALALELASRRITRATFEAVRRIEDGDKPGAEKLALVELALAQAPDLPILHLLKTNALIETKANPDAAAAARAGLAKDPDPDVRTRLLIALARVAPAGEARKLLEEAVSLDGNRIASAMARVMLLPRQVN